MTIKKLQSEAYPFFLKFSMIFMIESIGTAKLNPSAATTFITLTPTISPSRFTRGPPELPCRKQMNQLLVLHKLRKPKQEARHLINENEAYMPTNVILQQQQPPSFLVSSKLG
jgi:hypothetical protein